VDKGLSLGERSRILVDSCLFIENETAIAIKDETKLYCWNNEFNDNHTDYSIFIKKKIFNSPQLYVEEKENLVKLNNLDGSIHIISKKDIELIKKDFIIGYNLYRANSNIASNLLLKHHISLK
jgi:hypothetical protein